MDQNTKEGSTAMSLIPQLTKDIAQEHTEKQQALAECIAIVEAEYANCFLEKDLIKQLVLRQVTTRILTNIKALSTTANPTMGIKEKGK